MLDPSEKERLKALFEDQNYIYSFTVDGFQNPITFSFELRTFLRECKSFFTERGIEILDFYCKGGARGYALGERNDDLADLDLMFEIEDPGEKWKDVERTYLEFLCYQGRIAAIPDGNGMMTYCCKGIPIAHVKESPQFRDGASLFIRGGLLNHYISPEGFALFKMPTSTKGVKRPLDIDFAASKDRVFIRRNSCTGSDDCVCIKITSILEEESVWEQDFYAYALDGFDIHKVIYNSRLKIVEADLRKAETIHGGFRIHCKKLTEGKIYTSFSVMDDAFLKTLDREYSEKWHTFSVDLEKYMDEHFKGDKTGQILYLLNCADSVQRSKPPREHICEVLHKKLSEVLNLRPQKWSPQLSQRDFVTCRAYLYLIFSTERMRPRSLFTYEGERSLYILPVKERRCLTFIFSAGELSRDLKNIGRLVKESPLAQALALTFPAADRKLDAFGIEKSEAHFEKPLPILRDYFKDFESFALHYAKFKSAFDKQQIIEIQSYLFELLQRERDNPKISTLPTKISELLHLHASVCKGKATDKIFFFLLKKRDFFTLEQVRKISTCLVANMLRKGKLDNALSLYYQIATERIDSGELLKDLMKTILDKKRQSHQALAAFGPLVQAVFRKDSYFVCQNQQLKECIAIIGKNAKCLEQAFRLFVSFLSVETVIKKDSPANFILDLFFEQYVRIPARSKGLALEMLKEEISKVPSLKSDEEVQAKLKALSPEPEEFYSEALELKEGAPPPRKSESPKKEEVLPLFKQKICQLVNRMQDRAGVYKTSVQLLSVLNSLDKGTDDMPAEQIAECHKFLLEQEQLIWRSQEKAPKQVKYILEGFLLFHVRFLQQKDTQNLKTPFVNILKQHIKKELDWNLIFAALLLQAASSAELLKYYDSLSYDPVFAGQILCKIMQIKISMIMDWTNKSIRPVDAMPLFAFNLELLRKANQHLAQCLNRNKRPNDFSDSLLKSSVDLAFLIVRVKKSPDFDAEIRILLKTSMQKNAVLPMGWKFLTGKINNTEQLPPSKPAEPEEDLAEDISLFQALNCAAIEKSKDNRKKAIRYYETALDKLPDGDSDIYAEVINLYIKEGEIDTARDIITRAITRYPHESRFHVIIGQTYLGIAESLGRDKENEESINEHCTLAISHFLKCLPWKKQHPEILFNLAKCYQFLYPEKDVKNQKEALKYYKEYLKAKPNDEAVLTMVGEIACMFQDYKTGLIYFNKAIEAAPTFERAYICKLKVYKSTKRTYEEIISLLDNVIEKFPHDANWLLERGYCNALGDQPEEAGRDYLRAFALNPKLQEEAKLVLTKEQMNALSKVES